MLATSTAEINQLRANEATGRFYLQESQAKLATAYETIEAQCGWMQKTYMEQTTITSMLQNEITRLNGMIGELLQENELNGGKFARDYLGVFREPIKEMPAITMITAKPKSPEHVGNGAERVGGHIGDALGRVVVREHGVDYRPPSKHTTGRWATRGRLRVTLGPGGG